MKKIFRYSYLLVIILFVTACIEEFGEVGEPFNRKEQINGTWNLVEVIQVDEQAVKRSFPYQTLNLTNKFPYTDLSVSFSLDENGNPFSFQINKGNAPSILPIEDGNWTFDSEEFPTQIIFSKGDTEANLEFQSLNTLTSDQLELKFSRYQLNSNDELEPFVSYIYKFQKQ